jgi:hypothetical protein
METTGEATSSAWAEAQAKLWERGITPLREIVESALCNDRGEPSNCGAAITPMLEAQMEQAQTLAASLLSETGLSETGVAEEDAELRAQLNAVMERWTQVHRRFWDLWLAALGAAVNASPEAQRISDEELREVIESWGNWGDGPASGLKAAGEEAQ